MENKIDILLVDDRPDGLVTLQAVLDSPEYNLVTASSGREALTRLLTKDFAIIILDVQMPEMDGFETASLIKQRERSKYIPIIFVTAISKTPFFVFKGYEAGAVDYIFKPFDPRVLRSKVDVFVELFRKNRKLEEQTSLLKRSEEAKRSIIENATDIILTTDPFGVIATLSPAYKSITGIDCGAMMGKLFDSLFSLPDVEGARKAIRLALAGEVVLFESKVLGAHGEEIWIESSVKPLIQDGVRVGVLAIMRDVRERREAEKQRVIRTELERSNRELEQFAHICSHDLQEPLRTINSFAQLLKERLGLQMDDETKEIVASIMSGANRMSLLIRDLLSYAEFGSGEFPMGAIESAVSLDGASKNLRHMIESNQATIETSPMPVVMGNTTLLAQVFQNLLVNAIKFRGKQAPRVVISSEQRDGQWQFSIQDNGIGFRMEYSKKIFEVFRRLHHSDEFPGTGIGLGLCKRIVERQGGRIWAESTPGTGSTFYFTLPAVGGQEAEHVH